MSTVFQTIFWGRNRVAQYQGNAYVPRKAAENHFQKWRSIHPARCFHTLCHLLIRLQRGEWLHCRCQISSAIAIENQGNFAAEMAKKAIQRQKSKHEAMKFAVHNELATCKMHGSSHQANNQPPTPSNVSSTNGLLLICFMTWQSRYEAK